MLHSKTDRFAVPSSSESPTMPRCSSWRRFRSGSRITAALKALFDAWRAAGVISLRDYLLEDPARVEGLLRA